uniref:BTB domain-containing protein n=1 Tax=Panagrolaimus davidi TaxID=227884 RepID=A0A914QCK9_9BILA
MNDNGSIIPLEKILEILPYVKDFEYRIPDNSSHIITSKTVKELLRMPHFSIIRHFNLSEIPEDFDIESFYGYIKGIKNCSKEDYEEGMASIYLCGSSSNVIIEKMEIFIRSANFYQILECKIKKRNLPQSDIVFISHEDFLNPEKKFFVDDILTIEYRGIASYKKALTFIDLGNYLYEKDDKDFTFIVGFQETMAHKFILRQFSPILAADDKNDEMEIENFDFEIVRAAVELCYGIKYWGLHSVEKYFKLIEFTNKYYMPIIKDRIEQHLIECVNKRNPCEWTEKSLEVNAMKLHNFCINFLSEFINNFKQNSA